MKIKDCFGNSIEVTDLKEAIRQAEMFVGFSEAEKDGGFKFPEYKLVPSSDHFGKPTIIKQETNSGKWVRQLLYWKYTLRQLLKLSSVSLFICLLLASKSSGQTDCTPSNYLHIGGGAGFSNKNALANVIVGYNTNIIGVEASMIAHMDNINPAMFNGQLVKSFYTGNKRLTLLAGMSYQITTFDKVGGTKTLPIVGLEWARIMTYHDAVVYVRGQVTGDNFCLMVGLSGIFKSNKN